MGAWGAGIFEDDSALDFMEQELLPSSDPRQVMRAAFEAAIGADYVEYDMGHAVLVSAAAMRCLRTHEPLEEDEPQEWASWRVTNVALDMSGLSTLASKACLRVASEHSELNELWSENEELYPQWKTSVQSLASAVAT